MAISGGRARARSTTARAPIAEPREPRGARRKRETREKLLRAAFHLIAERGLDGVAVNEMTEAADVGFGSFYNHFESKEAIHAAVLGAVLDDFGDALEKLTADLEDPAEIIAVCVRNVMSNCVLFEPLTTATDALIFPSGPMSEAISMVVKLPALIGSLNVRRMRSILDGLAPL